MRRRETEGTWRHRRRCICASLSLDKNTRVFLSFIYIFTQIPFSEPQAVRQLRPGQAFSERSLDCRTECRLVSEIGESVLNGWNMRLPTSSLRLLRATSFNKPISLMYDISARIREELKRYFSKRVYSFSPPYLSLLSYPELCQRTKYSQDFRGRPPESWKLRETGAHRRSSYPISPQSIHRRGFHSFPVHRAKRDESCRTTETMTRGQSCKKKDDARRREKVKHDDKRRQPSKRRTEETVCIEPCFSRGKCELPRTVPPPKMEYARVTCPPPKFATVKPCPPMLERENDVEARSIDTLEKQVCAPPPLPKPPYGPTVLCPCPPPRKVHPGPCPSYEETEAIKPPLMKPCPPKEPYPCPTGVYYCPPRTKPCERKPQRTNPCEHRKEKGTPES